MRRLWYVMWKELLELRQDAEAASRAALGSR